MALEPGELIARGRSVVRRLAGGGAHEAFVVTARDPHQRAVAKLPRPQLGDDPHCLLRLQTEGGHSSGSLIRCCRGISTPC